MTAVRKPKAASQPSSQPFYQIRRNQTGFYIVSLIDGAETQISEPDIWPITASQLKNILRKDLGI